MKKLFFFIIIACMAPAVLVAQKKGSTAKATSAVVCCPEFTLAQDYTPPCRGNCKSDGTAPNPGHGPVVMMASCRSTHSYTVIPNLISSGFTYTWTITGGTPASLTGNPINITWNAGVTSAQIKVTITGPGGCNKTLIQDICLVDGPTANIITASPNPVCVGTPVSFGAATTTTMYYNWDFGDNTYGTGQNVTHAYTSTGPKTVILTVRGDTAQGGCGCIDRDTIQITVNPGAGLLINPVSCKKMFCPGDTATYCAVNCSGPYTWTITGGTPATYTGNCVTVTWNASSAVPASVTVSTPNCPAGCGGSATLQVPVLFPNLQINGTNLPDKVCPGSTTNYSLPNMTGAFYKWTLSGGGTIIGADSNVSNISVFWYNMPVPAGPYMVICNYQNPITGCKGADTMNVFVRPPFIISGLTTTCVGNSFMFNNGSITPGPATWQINPMHPFLPGGPSPGINGTWASPNTYTITATPVNVNAYCTPSATLVVTVNPKPSITAITPVAAICAGSTHIYNATSTMPGAGQFQWTVTGAAGGVWTNLGSHNDSVQVTWDNVGPYAISVTQTVAGCTSAPFSIPVNTVPNPTITPNPGPFCMDASSTFTASPLLTPGNYTWSITGPNNNLGSLMSPQGSNTMNVQWNGSITPGTATTTITVTNQCNVSASTPVNVITPNPFVLNQAGDLCNPTGKQLIASPGFTGYVFTGPSVSSPSGNTANALAPGLYTVTAQDANGCPVKAITHVLPKNLPPVTISTGSPLVYCPGDVISVTLLSSFSSSYTGCSYQWFQNGTPMPGQTAATLNLTAGSLLNNPGVNNFYLVITCGGCTVTSNTKTVTVLVSCPSVAGCPYAAAKSGKAPGSGSSTMTTVTGLGDVTITGPATNSVLCTGTGTFTSVYNLFQPAFSIAQAWWDFGDGTTSAGTQTGSGMGPYNNTAPHTYTNCGTYMVVMHVIVQCSPGVFCTMTDTIIVKVPAVAKFIPTVVCNQVFLQDQSSVCEASCNFNYAWTATGPGTVSFAPAATGLYSSIANTTVMTASASGTYTITLTLSSATCGCTGPNAAVYTQTVTINLPLATFTLPPSVCAGTPVNFTASGGTNYNWNFYSQYQSNLASTVHSFPLPPPGTRPVTLTVTDANGCSSTNTQNVTILPPLTVAIAGAVDLCPGDIITLTTNPVVFQTYQWYHNGIPVGNGASLTVSAAGEYWVEVTSNNGGCKAKSAKVTIKYKHAPIADIKPVSRVCLGSGGSFSLENITQELNTSYTWSLYSGPTTVTFSPNGTNAAWQTIATPASALAGDYIFILTAQDLATQCITSDTICIKAYNPPVFTVSGAGGCAGVNHTFTASPPATYNYLWSNGVTGNTMTTSLAGSYSVTATDPISGCFTTLFAGTVNPKPDLSLFPLSDCDTLCDSVKLVPPLALAPFQTYGIYTIKWYKGATLVHTGPFLNLNTLTPNPGQHSIHIVVTNSFGCSSTSGNYNVYVKPCVDCDCKESHWGEIQATEGQNPAPKNNVKANVPVPIVLNCGKPQTLKCNTTYTFNASYFCKDTACNSAVTYSLQPPVGSPVTGNLPFTFTTPNTNAVYILTLYGWCGGKICDSCIIDLNINCPPTDCCKESYWKDPPSYYFNGGGKPVSQKIDCNKETTILITGEKCKQPLVITGQISCPPNCASSDSVFVYDGANNIIQSGPAPLTINSLPDGNYTVVINGYCGGIVCLTCKLFIKVECKEKPCDCRGSKWNTITLSQQNNNPLPVAANAGKVGNNNVVINPVQLNCGKTYDVKCKTSYSVNAGYTCVGANCPGSVQYVFTGPTGTTTGTMPLNFSLTLTGTYTLTLTGYCGTTKCNECVIKFNVECPKDSSCCPYNITVGNPTNTQSTLASPAATIVNSTFNISGPPGNLFTEIRAEVADYVLTSNFNNECINCKSYPYSWASMYQPGPVGTMQPQITMYNSTAPAFNPSGPGIYQNPREVIWSSTSPFTLPTSINLSFLLPPISIIDCCELTAKICVKFTFRDNNCKECEVIVCFTVIIKPGGSDNNGTCNCSINPLFKYEGGSKAVSCGGSITLFQGNIPVTMNPNFLCTPAGKNCQPSGLAVQLVNNTNGATTTLASPNYSYTFLTPGNYTYVISGTCGGKKCDCKVTMIIPK